MVSKTRMRGGRFCVGGHDLDDAMRSVRLLRPDGTNMPADTRFEVGQVWRLDYEPAPYAQPPHVEDVLVRPSEAERMHAVDRLGIFLRNRVKVWTETLFDGKLRSTGSGAGYVPFDGPFPPCSTGYWSPTHSLEFDGDGRYLFRADDRRRRIRYVGVVEPVPRIDAGTLLRVSLARPWAPPNAPPGLYLQLSGWYTD
ncbi:MAG: dual OB domain-containing protein [Solirubrobacteraceae bacterium]